MIRPFYLYRLDEQAFVAEGAQFSDGTCVLHWLASNTNENFTNILAVKAMLGYSRTTRVFWEDMDFIHVPTGQPVFFTGAQITRPSATGPDELFDGWPSPEKDYSRIGRWLEERRSRP